MSHVFDPLEPKPATFADYEKRIAADPSYKATKSGDKVGWIVQNWGKEWLTPEGTAPQETIWTWTGNKSTGKIGSPTGIASLPWLDKSRIYNSNGEDSSRPQYANGPGMPSGGYKGTPEELQADRDRLNWYRNGGQGINPELSKALQGKSFQGLPQHSYDIPDYGTYTRGQNRQNRSSPNLNNYGSWRAGKGGGTGGGAGGPAPLPPGNGPVPIPPAGGDYVPLPGGNRFTPPATPAARMPWMQQMGNSDAMAQQQALIAALRGTNG